jgi:hypothetical protein
MFFWILQQIIISLVLIILVHRIYIFFKNNLTTPKVKDLVNKPPKQYDEIYQSMMEQPKAVEEEDSKPKEAMKAELKTYLKELSQHQQNSGMSFGGNFGPSMARFSPTKI